MNAPMNGHHNALATFKNRNNETSNASEVNTMTSTKTTGKLNMRITRNIASKFSVKILEVWPESHWPGFALRQTDVL